MATIVHCDTSFFVRQLIPGPFRSHALNALSEVHSQLGFVPITPLTRFEVIQALRLEAWHHRSDRNHGLPPAQVDAALNVFLSEVGTTYQIVPVDLELMLHEAERLSRTTPDNGWRTFDVLHVASALTLRAAQFLSYDKNQNRLAAAQGLKTPLAAI